MINLDFTTVLQYATRIIVIFLILPIHEYAHAFVANKLGDHTARYSGRLTINPISHIDLFGAICLLLTGFGWAKPVPVNPLNFKKSRAGMAITAAAGPISNLLVAFISLIVYRVVGVLAVNNQTEAMVYILFILRTFYSINIGLAIFNLIPIPPLDGSKILSYFTGYRFDKFVYQNQMVINIIFIIVILSGLLSIPLGIISNLLSELFWLITNWVPSLVSMII